ncbi:hypothetical protein L598_001500000270 [Mesorhizobium sp. J18]|uniref:DUF1214 domain-containing protein n=1 Tax=Mesorhizobium sp. J18 TaxID=935263 RepID=UPI00119B76EE|nr:DUF1214 domain-containing protein [Mesorhizobium sp. J18]TWG99304.1 hypothetical protein L598_001500000270 [Mesorhizobium sp. J18]
MLKTVLLIFVTLAVAIGGGAGSVWYALEASRGVGSVTIGQWVTFPDFGTPQADPYSRARFAREGGLSLGQAEGIAFTTNRDTAGALLRADCRYQLTGAVPPSRFWTVYATNAAGRLLPPVGRLQPALQSRELVRLGDGPATVEIGPQPVPGNWLPISGSGPIRLVLTVFDTPISGDAGVIDIRLPQVVRRGCDD